ncbi:TPA: hypothetical protein N2D16_002779 [Clostridium botulinum]|nr:hypothetical protein [Clostridium botulinum]HCL4455157.1 hypothetical protein [Clostridium botulinum]
MRGQWVDYDTFNLVDLIDEVKTRLNPPHRADDILHGAMIAGKNYKGACDELRKFLSQDDIESVKRVKREYTCKWVR